MWCRSIAQVLVFSNALVLAPRPGALSSLPTPSPSLPLPPFAMRSPPARPATTPSPHRPPPILPIAVVKADTYDRRRDFVSANIYSELRDPHDITTNPALSHTPHSRLADGDGPPREWKSTHYPPFDPWTDWQPVALPRFHEISTRRLLSRQERRAEVEAEREAEARRREHTAGPHDDDRSSPRRRPFTAAAANDDDSSSASTDSRHRPYTAALAGDDSSAHADDPIFHPDPTPHPDDSPSPSPDSPSLPLRSNSHSTASRSPLSLKRPRTSIGLGGTSHYPPSSLPSLSEGRCRRALTACLATNTLSIDPTGHHVEGVFWTTALATAAPDRRDPDRPDDDGSVQSLRSPSLSPSQHSQSLLEPELSSPQRPPSRLDVHRFKIPRSLARRNPSAEPPEPLPSAAAAS